jgi:hypothetical protein
METPRLRIHQTALARTMAFSQRYVRSPASTSATAYGVLFATANKTRAPLGAHRKMIVLESVMEGTLVFLF